MVEKVDEVEENATKEVMEDTSVHMKMGLTYQMSPVHLKI